MTRILFIIIGTFLAFFIQNANAQERWTLEECIRYALDNNINIKRENVSAEQLKNDYNQSKFEFLPNVNGSGTHSYRSGKTFSYDVLDYVNQEYHYGQVQINSGLTLFNGLENQNRMRMRKFNFKRQLENIEEAKYDVTMNVATYYLNILSKQEQKQIKEEQLNVTLDQIEQTRQQVNVGNKAKGDLLEIKAQAARERVELTRAENELKMAYVDLTQLMNLDSTENFTVYFPEKDTISERESLKSADAIYEESVKEFPAIKGAEFNLKSSEKNLDMMKGRRYPELNIGIGFFTYYDEIPKNQFDISYNEQVEENVSMIAELRLNIPIFNNRRVHNQIQNAKLALDDSKLQLEERKQNLYKDIQRARNEAISAYDDYRANIEAVNSSQEAFNYTEQKYEVGLVDIVEYKVAKKDLTEAKLNASQAKYNYFFRLMLLEFYRGEELTL
ncbi:MAG: TolC family protein [Bacteroidota bacterium]